MRFMLSAILFISLNLTAYADSISSLTLTDAEMQKLKKYFPTDDTSHLSWKGDPMQIALPLNKEKRIIFPDPVTVDVKNALTADQLRILNNNKSLYLTALRSFSTTRIYVTLKESGEVVLIDLTTNENASNETQQIDIKQNHTNLTDSKIGNTSTASESNSQVIVNRSSNNDVSLPELIRFAWQEVYAPNRLIQSSSSFSRTPMHTEMFVSDLVYGNKVIAHPESSWISDNHYVTAVQLRNKYPHSAHIDIRKDLCGDWLAATLYPSAHLKSYGNRNADSTMLFLVSNRPFGETMGVCHGNA